MVSVPVPSFSSYTFIVAESFQFSKENIQSSERDVCLNVP